MHTWQVLLVILYIIQQTTCTCMSRCGVVHVLYTLFGIFWKLHVLPVLSGLSFSCSIGLCVMLNWQVGIEQLFKYYCYLSKYIWKVKCLKRSIKKKSAMASCSNILATPVHWLHTYQKYNDIKICPSSICPLCCNYLRTSCAEFFQILVVTCCGP